MPPATKIVQLAGDGNDGEFKMHRGGSLSQVRLAYESWGKLSAERDNAILLFTGLSPSAHARSCPEDPTPGWWEKMIGPGSAIDTDRYYVVCVNSLGSCFGSTGPLSVDPNTHRQYRLAFPELTIEDIAKAGHQAMRALGINRLHSVIGASMGGMSALAYALQFPFDVEYMIAISAACHALPFTISVRSLQREIIRNDPAWKGGNYLEDEEPYTGMLLARKLGLMSYRAAEEWHQRFNRARIPLKKRSKVPFGIEFEVESYLDYNARRFVGSFDANSYLYLSRAMDLFDVADYGGSVTSGLSHIHTRRNLIIGVTTDILFPLEQQQQIADGLQKANRDVEFVSLQSVNGHDSFLIDHEHFSPPIERFFARTRIP